MARRRDRCNRLTTRGLPCRNFEPCNANHPQQSFGTENSDLGNSLISSDLSGGYRLEEDALADYIVNHPRGFTVSADLGQEPDAGIAVAINRTPLKYESGAFNDDGTLSEMFMLDLRLWVNDHRDLLDEYDGMLWIGGWCDPATGASEVNLTVVFKSETTTQQIMAGAFAREHRQKSVHDLATGTDIDTGGDGGEDWAEATSPLAQPSPCSEG